MLYTHGQSAASLWSESRSFIRVCALVLLGIASRVMGQAWEYLMCTRGR